MLRFTNETTFENANNEESRGGCCCDNSGRGACSGGPPLKKFRVQGSESVKG